MSLLETAKSLLRTYRIRPKRFLGQNFMIDSSIFPRMASYASLGRNDIVLDVGAGMGFLTSYMAGKCGRVLAVEADSELARILQDQLAGARNVKVIEGDIFQTRVPPFDKVVSIPPYNISSHLMLWLFRRGFDCAILVLQREFADRLVASVGRENYGWLTVLAFFHAEIELLDAVPKGMFYPRPEIDSVIVRFGSKKCPLTMKNEAAFIQFIRFLFTRRNRKVGGAVATYLEKVREMPKKNVAGFTAALPFGERRIRQLTPLDFGELANVVLR